MFNFSTAIRTYNGEKRLPLLLEKLRSQINTENLSWEIVIVDNNSADNTAKIIQEYQSNWHISCPIQYYFEPRQGASYARQRAMKEAKSPLVAFLDDDNLPSPDWVASAYAFGKSHPQVGVYNGLIHPIYEVSPPKNFERIASCLAIIEWPQTEPFCLNSKKTGGLLPPGAGIVIRKQAWVENVPDTLELKGPVSGSLTAKGEDIEAFLYIRNAGWEVWFNPAMHIYHQITKSRLKKEYLIRLLRGVGLSRHRTRMLGYKPWQRPLVIPLYMANDLRKAVSHRLKYGKELEADIVAASEMEMYLGSLESHLLGLREFLRKKN
ncbi:MAG: glycosyltransferase [Okeania sp. SIO2C9]|uniref:hormogonium polysaccharide biosynthesis glycosyltransferase HpsE n=1 Tax=Okeania sp. SIO2C9 TaxID=2607791 RepID=UPI0013BEDF66|nr:hormogonium polysaccharide biosynthesis glycosyltransferase HpsE [Okeania sp. SIO2C9]NEQ73518.1 glycosyltransferase [Okeania sp. SIO2C9]